MQKVQKMQSKNDTVPQKYLDIFVTIPHFFKITTYGRENETCNFEKRKVHFLVFSGHFGRVCLTAVQSSLKRCLIG